MSPARRARDVRSARSGHAAAAGARATAGARAATLLLGALLAGACGRPPAAVGVLLPAAGELAPRSRSTLDGVRLAWDALPPAARPLLLVEEDDGSPLGAAQGYRRLVESGARIVLGPLGTEAGLAAAAVAAAAQVPLVSPAATGDEVTRDNPWTLRACWTDGEASRALAAFARYELHLSQVAVVVDLASRRSLGLAEGFSREFALRRGRIVREVGIYPGEPRLAAVLDELAASGVEGVLIGAHHDDVVALAQGARTDAARRLVLLGADDWEGGALPEAVAGRFAGAYHVSHWAPDEPGEAQQAFRQAWQRAHDRVPDDFAALGYDAARMVFGVFSPDADSATLRARLHELHLVDAVTGAVHLDPSGNPRGKSIVLEQSHDPGRPRFVRRLHD